MAQGIIIRTNGTVEGQDFNGLSDYQSVVGGLITSIFAVNGDIEGYANDEGLLLGLPLNPVASILFGQYLVGNVVIIGAPDDEGKDTDATMTTALQQYMTQLQAAQIMHSDSLAYTE